jgi:hypothetical protein
LLFFHTLAALSEACAELPGSFPRRFAESGARHRRRRGAAGGELGSFGNGIVDVGVQPDPDSLITVGATTHFGVS